MKKDIKIIVILVAIIVLLVSGILFLMKSDILEPKSNNTAIKKEEEKKEEQEKEKEEEGEPEKEPTKEEEEIKAEEPKQDPIVDNKEENNFNNQNKNEEEKKEEIPEKPAIPTTKTLTCKLSEQGEEGSFTETVIATFSTSDNYIRSLKEDVLFDFTETYEPFTDEERIELESIIKEEFVKELDVYASGFTITSKSENNKIYLTATSNYELLKNISPDAFTPTGDFYYDNFYNIYVENGYVCYLE